MCTESDYSSMKMQCYLSICVASYSRRHSFASFKKTWAYWAILEPSRDFHIFSIRSWPTRTCTWLDHTCKVIHAWNGTNFQRSLPGSSGICRHLIIFGMSNSVPDFLLIWWRWCRHFTFILQTTILSQFFGSQLARLVDSIDDTAI